MLDIGFGQKRTCTLTIENSVRCEPTLLKVEGGWVSRRDCEWAFPGVCVFDPEQTRIFC